MAICGDWMLLVLLPSLVTVMYPVTLSMVYEGSQGGWLRVYNYLLASDVESVMSNVKLGGKSSTS